MQGLKQIKRGAINALVFTNLDTSVGELSFNGSAFEFSDPVTFTGVQLLPNGSAASPSLAFTNTTGMGIYRSGSNVLGFATAGQEVATIDAQGDLNVGTNISIGNGGTGSIIGDKLPIVAGATTTVLTAADSGKVFNIKAVAASTYTLPAPVAGLHFKWIWTVNNTDAVIIKTADITDTSGDMFVGGLLVCAAAGVNTFVETSADNNTITMEDDAAKCGGGVGSWIDIVCTEDAAWYVSGIVNSTTDADNVGVGLFTDADA